MKLELRPYQREAVNAAWEWMRANEGNPAVVIPTAGGKTLIMAEMARQAVEQWHGRVMIAAHTRELVAQNEAKLRALWPAANVGMYAVSHRRRDRFNPVVVAQVQSAAKKAHVFGHVDLLIVDECHRIPPVGEGLYLTLIAGLRRFNPRLRVIGMTATPYRLQGRAVAITGPGKLLTAVAYEARIPDLIRDGYLCPLVSRDGGIHADLTGVRTRGGEYVEEDLAAAVDRPELVEATCREMLARAGDRRAWIVFGVSVAHAEHVAAELVRLGVTAEVVHGGMSTTDRAAVLGRFERREIRALVNVNVLSEGFDAPHIDMVAMLRPTKSPGLMYQQIGRGFRLHPDKANCLVLDFAANLLEHGPVDQIRVVKDRKKKDGTEVVKGAVKKCPKCEALVHFALRECPECQHQFPAPTRQMHGDQPIDAPVLSGQRVPGPRRVPVTRVRYAQHIGKSGIPTVQVTYLCGLATFREWLGFEHGGVARAKAVAWWTQRTGQSVAPRTVKEALEAIETRRITPRKPAAIYVSAGGKYEEIIGVDWNDDSDRTVQPDRAA